MLSARTAVQNLKEYHPPLSGRIGLRLDFNESTVGASPSVLQRLRELDAEQIARYPDREPVEAQVASFLGMRPQEVSLTNGVDEAIHLLCQTYLDPSAEALVVVPTFSMYELFMANTGARVIPIYADQNFAFPTDKLLAAINVHTRLITIANPNNPTGTVACESDLLAVTRKAANAAVLIDEAYFEFYGATLVGQIQNQPNLFVARTFSKAYGMAGLRVGVLAGCAEQMRMVRKITSPYNVNSAALAALPAALKDQDYVEKYVREVRAGRERLQETLRSLGIGYWPSKANFVLADFGPVAHELMRIMARRGILLRDRSSDPGCAGCIRITIGTNSQTELLLTTLEEAFEEIRLKEGKTA